jgi:CRP/FNR family transcriptional regulator, cyclic AMP receptor protein
LEPDFDFLNLFSGDEEALRLSPGDKLFAKGDPATTMFVVRTGSLQVHDGNIIYETIGPGGILGEMAIVDGAPRSAGVRAEHESEVIAIDRARFLRMVERTPFFSIRIMQVLTRRLRNTNERVKLT